MTGKNFFYKFCLSFLLFTVILFQTCTPVASYSETAYTQAIRLKLESLELMSKATEGYSNHSGKADTLKRELRFAYEYAKGKPNNELTAKQWEIMINPDRNLIGGFLRIWKEDLTLTPVFVSEAQGVIGDAFDTIIGLESGKIKPSQLEEQ
ncbi:MAG TPA: hypothetical protein VKD08_15450 [Ignavibacteriaceae bacterium]|nr:hypothetical protein [Ignavibacteriaceae bacterium]